MLFTKNVGDLLKYGGIHRCGQVAGVNKTSKSVNSTGSIVYIVLIYVVDIKSDVCCWSATMFMRQMH